MLHMIRVIINVYADLYPLSLLYSKVSSDYISNVNIFLTSKYILVTGLPAMCPSTPGCSLVLGMLGCDWYVSKVCAH